MQTGKPPLRSAGTVYLLLLLLLASVALAASHGVRLGTAFHRREVERNLLSIGMAYRNALVSYARQGGGAPATLHDLLRDPRMPGVVRHLRRLYPDPLCGCPWGLVRNAEGGIVGVFSQAKGVPALRADPEALRIPVKEARSYADWVFGPDHSLRPGP